MKTRRPLLLPLVPLYAAALRGKKVLAPAPRWLAHPVVSVGSFSAGGAGKTPVVAALAQLLKRHGYAVDVLSRGYGRTSNTVQRVDAHGTVADFGDEPLLLAREAAVPVYVGADRYTAGLLAESERAGDARMVHLLDDGFQHRKLGRNLDLVLLTQADIADCLLPAGNLREPLSQLQNADVVILREEEEATLRPLLSQYAASASSIWILRRQLTLDHNIPTRPVAFCGIARPGNFFHMLSVKGIRPTQTVAFQDHHAYRESDIKRLLQEARRSGADGFLTTEKDAVKITDDMRSRLESVGPMTVARLTVIFPEEDDVFSRIRTAISSSTA